MAGLILFVIVGAWFAVLVPMALRSHESATSLKSADRFGDAMRVLSRRSSRDVLVPRRTHDSLVVSETRSPRPARPVHPPGSEASLARTPSRPSAAARRRRTLLVLVGVSWLSLVLALTTSVPGALVTHLGADALLVAFVAHLRHQAVLKARRSAARRVALSSARPAAPVRHEPAAPRPAGETRLTQSAPAARVAAPAPTAQVTVPAARYEDKPLVPAATVAAATAGAPWSPVPVPPPMYVGKATAPRRPTRVLDLTKPGEWAATLGGEDLDADFVTDGPELEDILDRKRAVNDW